MILSNDLFSFMLSPMSMSNAMSNDPFRIPELLYV